ncbi:hypothetical protein [Tahibacter sp.]|uniref:hypothetical protein n=1 Tax=Tahibacter sp. TaxID=2056211 RepID=UPI0028C4C11F|nr:hypothetical protein [Tahibacter sp.]
MIGGGNKLWVRKELRLNGSAIDSTDSIAGLGLSAAGAEEFAACALQMRHSMVHLCPKLN